MRLETSDVQKEDQRLLAPCGLICAGCDWYTNESSEAAQRVIEIWEKHNLPDVAILKGLHSQDILHAIETLKKYVEAGACPGCHNKMGRFCVIANCVIERRFWTCAECEEFNPDVIPSCTHPETESVSMIQSRSQFSQLLCKRYDSNTVENLKKYREIGYPAFIEEIKEKIGKGWRTWQTISKEMVFSKSANTEKDLNYVAYPFRSSSKNEMPFSFSFLDRVCGYPLFETPHRHTYYEIIYVTHGDGTHFIDFDTYILEAPSVYFISPGQVHYWRLRSNLDGCMLRFGEDFLASPSSDLKKMVEITFFHTMGEVQELRLEQEQCVEIEQLMTSIKREFQTNAIDRASVLRAYFYILIVQLQRLFIASRPRKNSVKASSLVRKFKHLVAEHFATERSVEAYADKMGVSASLLNNTLKSMTGYTPGEVIRNEITLEAKRLLAHTELNITEVGYRLHFEDPFYFGRFFRRETGMNPSAFREKYQNIQE